MPPTPIAAPTNAVSSILANDARTFNLVILEAADDGVVIAPASVGPYTVAVADPSGLLAVTPGSPDNTTATTFKLAGSSATGSATITVTDTSNNLVGSATLAVTAVAPPPPPPPAPPTQLAPFIVPQ